VKAPKKASPNRRKTMSQTQALDLAPSAHDDTATGSRRIGRRIGAVFAGLFAIFAVTTAVDIVLHVTGVFPPMGQIMSHGLFALAAAYRAVIGVAGSYLTARIAPDRPVHHALALGAIGALLGTLGAVVMWDKGPAWYSLAVIAMTFPCAYLGGRLARRK
jgi:hypothetical protein